MLDNFVVIDERMNMKSIRCVFLDGDPFEFCHACNFQAREKCMKERLNEYAPRKKLDLLRKNLSWIMQRALIVLCAQNDGTEADKIWRMCDVELWQYWSQNVHTLHDAQSKINGEPDEDDVKRIEELCTNVMEVTRQIQEHVWRCKRRDICKKLDGYESLQHCPREKQVLYDIRDL